LFSESLNDLIKADNPANRHHPVSHRRKSSTNLISTATQ
jgi:hypothetical protein